MKIRTTLCLITLLILSGCSKLTKENYDKLKMGMSQKEISQVLGSADSCSKALGTTSCIWGKEDSKHVKIVFMGDSAVTFSYDALD